MNRSLGKFLTGKEIRALGDIKWAHAVNDVKYLKEVLANPKVHFLEVDIDFSRSGDPIAAHYSSESDLNLATLLNNIKYSKKGLKLDFKDPRAVIPTLALLKESQLLQPVILNADILSTKGAPAADIEPEWFIKNCQKHYPMGLLSLGWRTTEVSLYSKNDVNKMLDICRGIKEVTFPIRASLLPDSWPYVKKLIKKDYYTLTIWDSRPMDHELKQWLIKNMDPNKCFYDLGL
jgi:hypothetical protein